MKKLKDNIGKALFLLVIADGVYHLGYTVFNFLFGVYYGVIEKKNDKKEESETENKNEGEA